MNILLIYPEFPDTFWSFKHVIKKFIEKDATLPPLGLVTIAAMLPKEWALKLIDMNVDELTAEDISWADFAFVSSMTVQKESVLQIIEICKKAGLPIVAGGPLFTTEYTHVDFESIAHLILGEAESSLPPFLEDLKNGNAKRIYKPVGHPDIKNSPSPLWGLLKLRKYASMSVQYSRGCPGNCDFCNITSLFGRKVRTKTAEQMIVELDNLWKAGWKRGRIFLSDDNLIGAKKRAKYELLPALIKWRLTGNKDISFNTQTPIYLADDDELVKLFVEANIVAVFIGIESPNEDSLVEYNKHHNLNRDMVADIKKLQHAGIQTQGGFIWGADHDTPETYQLLIDFIQKSGIVTAMVGLLQAPPGTELYKRLTLENRIIGAWDGDIKGKTNVKFLVKREIVIEMYERIIKGLYAPKPYYLRIITFLREFKPPRVKHRIHAIDVSAGLKAIILFGFKGEKGEKGRRYFWYLMFWTIFRRPKSLPKAIEMAIKGYHYKNTYKNELLKPTSI